MFAIDGCKLPSNASKEWSGTRADFEKKKQKMEGAMRYLLKQHRERDKSENDSSVMEREAKQLKTLREKVKKIKRWLDDNDDKPGKGGKLKKSNITDNESAKMKSAHGILQGYDGVATVDAKHQVIRSFLARIDSRAVPDRGAALHSPHRVRRTGALATAFLGARDPRREGLRCPY